jgi:23S rRNA (uracil1939-C5)-methyltransferase
MALIGNILAIAKGGAGIVRDGDRTVFVPGVVAGETVEYSVSGRLRSAWQGKLLRVLQASPQRSEPPCPHYGDCGGCNLQHMSYGEQLRSKAGILAENLRRIAGFEPASPTATLPSPDARYRCKAEFQVRGGACGFFARDSRRIVAISGCLLLPQAVESHFLSQRRQAAGCAQGRILTVSNGRDLASCLEVPGGGGQWLSREHEVRFQVGPYAFLVAPGNFVQANRFQLRSMLGLLEGVLDRERPETAADLFCGGGFLTLPLAARCQRVLAVESDPGNVAALRANLALNRAGHVGVVQADAFRAGLPGTGFFVVDPPRGGLSPRLIAALAASGARTVVYFSCDSATFARDLRLFLGHGFKLDELKLLDNFPHSDHFEIFSVLKRAAR